MTLRTLRLGVGASVRELAALADVSPTTITRIESSQGSPNTDIFTRLLAMCGRTITTTPCNQPSAIAAARRACDPRWAGVWPDGADQWLKRFRRAGWLDGGRVLPGKKTALLTRVGMLNPIYTRPRLARYTADGPGNWADIVNDLTVQGVGYALTGGAAANLCIPMGGNTDPIIYVEDMTAAAQAARLRPDPSGVVKLLPFDGICETDATLIERPSADDVTIVARDQLVIDCVGLPEAGWDQAQFLTGERY